MSCRICASSLAVVISSSLDGGPFPDPAARSHRVVDGDDRNRHASREVSSPAGPTAAGPIGTRDLHAGGARAYQVLDLVPEGRDEAGLSCSMEWLERHDAYDPAPMMIGKGLTKRP
jgi:hypothetical protein